MEVHLSKKPKFRATFNQDTKPHGPNIRLKSIQFTENVKTDHRVEKVVDDTDLKAASAVTNLYKKGIDEHKLTRLMSIGNLGVKTQRKLVPTRWSITAVDDTLGKKLIKEVKQYPEGNCTLHIGGHLGNYYLIMFFDDLWSYELYEGYLPRVQVGGAWETDFENYTGRTEYAKETAGGYYAARLSILEQLQQRKRQASVLAIRFITEEYTAPLGVWVVREAVRKAMDAQAYTFADRETMKQFVLEHCKKKFNYNANALFSQSRLLKNIKVQTRLKQWF